MKKMLSILLAALMILSALSATAFAADKFPAPAAPTGLKIEDGVASWDAVEDVSFYKVELLKWSYDKKLTTWKYAECGKEYQTEDTSLDLKEINDAGKYIFAVTAYKNYELEKQDGTVTVIKRFSEASTYDVKAEGNEPYEVTVNIFGDDGEDVSIPFEDLIEEDDETGNMLLDLIKKLVKVFRTILTFIGFIKDKTPEKD